MSERGQPDSLGVIKTIQAQLSRFQSEELSAQELGARLSELGAKLAQSDDSADDIDETPTVVTHIDEVQLDEAIDDLLADDLLVEDASEPISDAGGSTGGSGPDSPQSLPRAGAPREIRLNPDISIQAVGHTLGVEHDTRAQGGGHEAARLSGRYLADLGRYTFGGEIARGGQGRIIAAMDEVAGRPLAFKVLHPEAVTNRDLVSRFWEEAQITGQLEHPHIVPVHDMGWREDGSPFYTMKRIEGQTLRKVIIAVRKGREPIASQYSQVRLLGVLQKVCQAVAYAHVRGVIHRDLKPANVMVGGYGEVLVLDWGVAKVRGAKDRKREILNPVMTERRKSGTSTLVGTVEGTPSYMSPEQARGEVDAIDERSDVYALGAILYEILTYRPPFKGKDWRKVLEEVVRDPPVPPRVLAPERNIPPELEAICLKCLSKRRDDRYPSAEALEVELESFLEGTKRREAAKERVAKARERLTEYKGLRGDLTMARLVARRASQGLEGWEPVERKRGIWATVDKVTQTEARLAVAFGECAALFGQALAFDPDNHQAREGLADLYRQGLVEAEGRGDVPQQVYYEEMVRQYHDGKYQGFLKGDGRITFRSNPPGAEVWIATYETQDRVLKAVQPRCLGRTPLVDVTLPQGSYLLVLKAPGFLDLRYPLYLGREAQHTAELRMRRAAEIADGFVVIPGGPFRRGGDLEAIDPLPTEDLILPSYAITRFPITFKQYLSFLDAVAAGSMEEAESHIPWLDDRGALAQLDAEGRFAPVDDLMTPEVRDQLYGLGAEWDLPVFGVDPESAEAFCLWAGQQTGRPIRLPSEDEWEKAARGMDRRTFPWGEYFDATFCKSRLSRPYAPEPEPVGAFGTDTSPYGVQDMAGAVREWCDGWYSELEGLRVLRGGGWADTGRQHRAASRSFYDPQSGRRLNGFRCAFSLE